MSVQISRSVLQKLTHNSTEIRLRALEQVEAKLLRALAHNETLDFQPGELCKQLVRWFGQKPLQATGKVLELLARLLRSQYGDGAVERLGLERLQREMGKVQQILRGRASELQIVAEIQENLQERSRRNNVLATDNDDDLVQLIDAMSMSDDAAKAGDNHADQPVDYEVPWSKPSVADFSALKLLADILANPLASAIELQNTLQHLQIAMVDYPAEYMLQAPHIYVNLLQLFGRTDNEAPPALAEVAATILTLLRLLEQRLDMRRQCLAYAPPQGATVLGRTQLRVDKALNMLMQAALQHLHVHVLSNGGSTTLQLLELCWAALDIYRMQRLCVERTSLQRLFDVCETLRASSQRDELMTLPRVKYLLCTCLLQDAAAINASREPLSSDVVALFAQQRNDYALRANFPQRHERLSVLLYAAEPALAAQQQMLSACERLFHQAMALLRDPKSLTSAAIVQLDPELLCRDVVDRLQSVRLVELLFGAIVDCNAASLGNAALREAASRLLLQLLQLTHGPLRLAAHQRLAQAVKRHFACLMNGECYCAAASNARLLAGQIVGVPLSTALVVHLAGESDETNSDTLRQHCIDLLVMLLQAEHLLGASWPDLLALLLPALPLLQCCTDAPRLLDLLLQLYDPDARRLPFLAVLQGNVGLLLHPEDSVRGEALTRLIYILSSLETAPSQYVPNMLEISDLLPNDLCLVAPPRKLARIFADADAFLDVATLHNLLGLLEQPDIEPLIRKTTLMQLNVLCQSWSLTLALCAESGHYLVLLALENSLQSASHADYPDAAIPAISILAKVLLCDTALRQQLAATPNIYVLLLRALALYPNDIQVRQDASICLLQLLYASYMVVVMPEGQRVELPALLANIQLPLECTLHTHRRPKCVSSSLVANFGADADLEASYLRQAIAVGYCGAHERIDSKYVTATQCQLDVAAPLRLTQRDWRLMRATAPAHNLRRFQHALANATEHRALVQAVRNIRLLLQLLQHCPDDGTPPVAVGAELYGLLARYLQQPPGSEEDHRLYVELLDLCALCVRLPLPAFTAALCRALHADFQHAFVTLLSQRAQLARRTYAKLCQLLVLLLGSEEVNEVPKGEAQQQPAIGGATAAMEASLFRSNLYELASAETAALFGRRDLQGARCLMSLLRACSARPLNMPDRMLLGHCKRFLQYSLALKSLAQTGAQWQRDCLQQVCQLQRQMEAPRRNFQLQGERLKYLSALCGHSDMTVRALAWSVLGAAARLEASPSSGDDGDAATSGAQQLLAALDYLPGGFLACCLSGLVDGAEALLVRQLAGRLCAELLSDGAATLALLQQHDFFRCAHDSLAVGCLLFERTLPPHFANDVAIVDCGLVSAYCRICCTLLTLLPDYVTLLCAQPLMHRLYELLKLPPPTQPNPAYGAMCAHICQLYCRCYAHNFPFLQRTLCRDQAWLAGFCRLLQQPCTADELESVSVLQLLLVLCRDSTAYEALCTNFARAPAFIGALFLRACDVPHLNTPLQRSTLAALALLLIKSQPELELSHKTFAHILDEATTPCGKDAVAVLAAMEADETSSVKENGKETPAKINLEAPGGSGAAYATLICQALVRLFSHLYTTRACKFETAPNAAQIQINETLAVLLKVSRRAQDAAQDLKLFDKIANVFHTFHEEFNTACATFVRRYGETRKMAVVKNLQLLCSLLLNWYAAPTVVLRHELHAHQLAAILVQIWPWLGHSGDLKLLVLQLCAFVSDEASTVCQQFAALGASSPAVLQLIIKLVVHETTKVKAASTQNFPVVAAAMRVLINCCNGAAEARACLAKERILDTFDVLYPFNVKSPKLKPELLHAWLQFWEVFSGHAEGAALRNVSALCALVTRSPPRSQRRLHSLRILRNMCCQHVNRSQLMASEGFLCAVHDVIAQPMELSAGDAAADYEEQLLMTVAVQQLISGGVKYVAMLRGTNLARKFRMLREHLQTLEAEDCDRLLEAAFALSLMEALSELLDKISSS